MKKILFLIVFPYVIQGFDAVSDLKNDVKTAQGALQDAQNALGIIKDHLSQAQSHAQASQSKIKSCPEGGLANTLLIESERMVDKTVEVTIDAIKNLGLPGAVTQQIVDKIK